MRVIIVISLFSLGLFGLIIQAIGSPYSDLSFSRILSNLHVPLTLPASIIGKEDGRLPISKSYSDAGLSKSEYEQSLSSIGLVHCLKSRDEKPAAGVGTIVGSRNEVITSAHVIAGNDGNIRKDIENCVFLNNLHPYQYHRIVLGQIVHGSGWGAGSRTGTAFNDYAIFRIIPPVKEAKPYLIDTEDVDVRPGQTLLMISNTIEGRKFGKEPKLQKCFVKEYPRVENGMAQGGAEFKTDCSQEPGDSGSPAFVRNDAGLLVVKGVLSGQGVESFDHCTYDVHYCWGVFTEITGPFLESLRKF